MAKGFSDFFHSCNLTLEHNVKRQWSVLLSTDIRGLSEKSILKKQ